MKVKRQPNYTDLNYAERMGSKLRALVESHLVDDLRHYGVSHPELRFDWSDICIEGHSTDHLDGSVENFSGIVVFDNKGEVVADGWMEFVHQRTFFLAYWEFVRSWDGDRKRDVKDKPGIPLHVWKQLPDSIRTEHKAQRI